MTVTLEAPEVQTLPFHAKPGDLVTYRGEVFVHVLRGVWQLYREERSFRDRSPQTRGFARFHEVR